MEPTELMQKVALLKRKCQQDLEYVCRGLDTAHITISGDVILDDGHIKTDILPASDILKQLFWLVDPELNRMGSEYILFNGDGSHKYMRVTEFLGQPLSEIQKRLGNIKSAISDDDEPNIPQLDIMIADNHMPSLVAALRGSYRELFLETIRVTKLNNSPADIEPERGVVPVQLPLIELAAH